VSLFGRVRPCIERLWRASVIRLERQARKAGKEVGMSRRYYLCGRPSKCPSSTAMEEHLRALSRMIV